MIIDTKHLHLRPVVETDIANTQRYFAMWDVIKHLKNNDNWPYPCDGAEKFYHDYIKLEQGKDHWFWAINEKDNPNYMIGEIELDRELPSEGEHIGFWLGTPYHGKGYMTEALTAIRDVAFTQLNFEFLRINCAVSNPASKRVIEKSGFKHIGSKKYSWRAHSGEDMNDEMLLTRDEWLELKQN